MSDSCPFCESAADGGKPVSIYSTIPGLGGDGDDEELGAPWVYRGSHILPAEDGPRGGGLGLALIPSHITADGRDDQPEDGTPWPWLRVSMDHPDALLNPAQARHVARQFDRWADQAGPQPAAETEQLPAAVLALLPTSLSPANRSYLSNACRTARLVDGLIIQNPGRDDLPGHRDGLHQDCATTDPYTGTPCHCPCHIE